MEERKQVERKDIFTHRWKGTTHASTTRYRFLFDSGERLNPTRDANDKNIRDPIADKLSREPDRSSGVTFQGMRASSSSASSSLKLQRIIADVP